MQLHQKHRVPFHLELSTHGNIIGSNFFSVSSASATLTTTSSFGILPDSNANIGSWSSNIQINDTFAIWCDCLGLAQCKRNEGTDCCTGISPDGCAGGSGGGGTGKPGSSAHSRLATDAFPARVAILPSMQPHGPWIRQRFRLISIQDPMPLQ